MPDLNTISDENSENTEKISKSKVNIKEKFLNEFSKSFLAGKDKNRFIDEIMNNESIESSDLLLRKIKAFKAYSNDPDIKNFSEKIDIYELKRAVGASCVKLINSRNNYISHTSFAYGLKPNQINKLDNSIKSKNEYDLDELISSDLENKKFLGKVFGKNKVSKTDNFRVLDSISSSDTEKRLKKLSPENRKNVETSLFNLKNLRGSDTDIKELFSTGFLNKDEKKEIISQFIPYISLQKSVDLGLITIPTANNYKSRILGPILRDKGIPGSQLKDIIDSSSLNDIKIKSTKYFTNESELDSISEKVGFIKFENDLKKVREEIIEKNSESGPQSFSELIGYLESDKIQPKIGNISLFGEGNFVKVISKDKSSGEEIIRYNKISNINESDKTVSFIPVGDDSSGEVVLNLSNYGGNVNHSFSEIYSFFTGDNGSVSFHSKSELEGLINSKGSGVVSSELEWYNPSDLTDHNKKTEILAEYNSIVSSETIEINLEIERLDNEIISLENDIKYEKSKDRKKILKERKETLGLKKSKLEIDLKSISDGNNYLGVVNNFKLKEKIDKLDLSGKSIGFSKGIYLESEINGKKCIHEVVGIDNLNVFLRTPDGRKQELTFDSFVKAFEKNGTKRVSKISSLDELLKKNSDHSDNKDIWNNYEVKNGKLHIQKVDDHSIDKKTEVNYFTTEGSNGVYKIESIYGDKISVRYGERKDLNNKKGEKEGEHISLSKNVDTYSLNEFNIILNQGKKGFTPDWQTGKIETTSNSQELQNQTHGKFSTWLFDNHLSLSELISGGKLVVDNFTEYLAKGNDIHSARAAIAMGKILPKDIADELRVKVDRAEGESMDKEIESLGKVDSDVAVKRIKGWLLNRNTPEFKKEAGMLFMMENYGSLTVKPELYQFRGKFLWYEAFGGRIGDKLYLEIKSQCEGSGIQFTEEKLMRVFLLKQCKSGGYNGIKRRSRLHKEFEGKGGAGINDELEKGEKEAKQKRTFDDRNDLAFSELSGGGDANALGKYLGALDEGGSLEEMNSFPFVVLFSGAGYSMREEVSNKWRSIVGDFGGLMFTKFLADTTSMNIFNETVLALSKRFSEEYPSDFKNMGKEAQIIFNNQKSTSNNPSPAKKIEEAKAFWNKYGNALTRSMSYLNDQDDKYAKTDKILILEEGTNSTFKKYNSQMTSLMSTASFSKKDTMKLYFKGTGVTGFNSHKVLSSISQLSVNGDFKDGSVGESFWNEFLNELKNIAHRKNNGTYNENQALKLLSRELRSLFAFLIEKTGKKSTIQSITNGEGVLGSSLANLGLNKRLNDFRVGSGGNQKIFTSNEILSGDANSIIEKIGKDFLSGSTGFSRSSDLNQTGLENITNISEGIKKRTNNSVEKAA